MLLDLVTELAKCRIEPAGKHCGRCGETKPLEEFAARNRYDGGKRVHGWCKECHRRANREWYRTRGKAMRDQAA